jgi:hypothetical protein
MRFKQAPGRLELRGEGARGSLVGTVPRLSVRTVEFAVVPMQYCLQKTTFNSLKGCIREWNENIEYVRSSKQCGVSQAEGGDETMSKFGLILLLCAFVPAARAATYTAASCNLSDVQTAFNNEAAHPANGDVIVIPSGTCSWSGTIVANPTVTLTIQGSTTISANCAAPPTHTSACTATDNTVLEDGRSGGGSPLMGVYASGSTGQEVRLTGISFNAQNQPDYNGILATGGGGAAGPQIRIDHCHFYNLAAVAVLIYEPEGYGVVDHNVVDVPGGNTYNGFKVYGGDGEGYGFWNQPTGFGGSGFTFIENNTFNNGFPNDCNAGGKYVFRYNVMNSVGNSSVQSHAVGSALDPPLLGCRAWEVYGNYLADTQSGGAFSAEFQTSGTGLSWNNTVTGFNHDIDLVSDRDNGSTNYSQTAPPNGWGYCGSTESGIASSWDGNVNSNGSNGWPCLSQPGRGQGDLLQGTAFPTICDSTLGCVSLSGGWPKQYLEPVYSWEESFTGAGSGPTLLMAQSPNNNIQANRDYYMQAGSTAQTSSTSPFSGSSGTGWGTLTNRPSGCTAGPGGSAGASPTGSYGVAYFATDANSGLGELYVCTSTNTWTAVYEPYTYPHPLVGGGSPTSGTPAPPTNLTASVQ